MPETPAPSPPQPLAPATDGQPAPAPKPQPFHKRHKRALLITLAAIVLLAALAALLFKDQIPAVLDTIDRITSGSINVIQKIGPVAFFTAYAILPAVGFSLSFFNVFAGAAFAGSLGFGWVLVLAAVCINIANVISYWLSRFALRPFIAKFVAWLGYTMPAIPRDEHYSASLLVRALPGVPFFVQSYLLGLAKVRFVPYMIISFFWRYAWAVALIRLGQLYGTRSDSEGESGSLYQAVSITVALLVLLAIITHWVRKYYMKPKAAPSPPRM